MYQQPNHLPDKVGKYSQSSSEKEVIQGGFLLIFGKNKRDLLQIVTVQTNL
jgi:hypothetical protein